MKVNQWEVWIADMNPQVGTEVGKTRPVLILQTNLLNKIPHPSTIICPITTNIHKDRKSKRKYCNYFGFRLHMSVLYFQSLRFSQSLIG